MSDFLFALFGGTFLTMTIINMVISIYFSENTRLSNSVRFMRRNLHPELAVGWMFLFFFMFEDLVENSFIQLIIPVLGYTASIYLVLRSGSFTSENQKYLHLAVYLTGLWFTLARHANYILTLIDYELEHPLGIFFLGYVGLAFSLIFKSKTLNIEDSFKSLTTYGEFETERLVQNLENLILLYKGSENNAKKRIILLGYVSEY